MSTKSSPYEKRMKKLIQHIRTSVAQGVLITERDDLLRQELLRTCDRLDLRLADVRETFTTLTV